MDLGTTTLLVGGGIGAALALFGMRMLVTGRAPAATAKAFRTVRDAAWYHLLFGVALVVLVAGTSLRGPAAIVAAVLAVAMVLVAVMRYRPRGRKPGEE
jgi:hypothetical protein